MIRSVSEIGDMVDFLKANPFMTMEDYLWNYSIPMIQIMGMDNTHIYYLTDNEVEERKQKANGNERLKNESGVQIF